MGMRIGLLAAMCVLLCVSMVARGGIDLNNDGSFSYQGYIEEGGVPANGDYYFRFRIYETNVGGGELSPLFAMAGPVTVVDGLFVCDILMGGGQLEAIGFWREFGDRVKYLNIEVGLIEGGPYEELSPRVFIGSTPHALHSQFAQALTFPYTDSYTNEFADPVTMVSLTNEFGGTVLELTVGIETNEPTLRVSGRTLFNDSIFGSLNGAVQINSSTESTGLMSISDQFPVIGYSISPSSANRASILGEVNFSANPDIIAVWALNQASGNRAALGTGNYSGDFNRDVLVRGDLRVHGEPTRDYAFNSPSPIGPLAYGSVSAGGSVTAGTANLSATWDAANLRYIVSVAGESLAFWSHTVSISVVDSVEPRVATFTGGVGGTILVTIWDLNSGYVAVQDNFSIVIYDATPVVLNRMAVPDGVDADKYSEETGAVLIETRPRHEPVEPFESYGSGVGGRE